MCLAEPEGNAVARRRSSELSSALCREVLAALDRVFVAEGPDEPDLGLNVAYERARLALSRLAAAEAWVVPRNTAQAIRETMTAMLAARPGELERQLLSFPTWALRVLDRRDPRRPAGERLPARRRVSDMMSLGAVPAYPAASPTASS
jgi:hypothetical protein